MKASPTTRSEMSYATGQSRRRPALAAAVGVPLAKASEAFTWKLLPGVRKRCRQCGREPLRVQDVGEQRTHYPSHRVELLCKECQSANVARAVEAHRRAAGLEARAENQGP